MEFPLHIQKLVVGDRFIELFVPDGNAVKQMYKEGKILFPYWSKVWPAAIAMADFLERHQHYTAGKKVLELGAGLGLPSMVAAPSAASVHCTDADANAVACVQKSAAHLGLKNFSSGVMDWQHLPGDLLADVVLLSDVNYETTAFAFLHGVVQRFLTQGSIIILSTPQRLVAKEFVNPLLPCCVHREAMEEIEVIVLQAKSDTIV